MSSLALVYLQMAPELSPDTEWMLPLIDLVSKGVKIPWPITLAAIILALSKFVSMLFIGINERYKLRLDHEYRMKFPHTRDIKVKTSSPLISSTSSVEPDGENPSVFE